MKKILLVALLLSSSLAFSQGIRWDLGSPGGSGVATTSGSGLPYLIALPGVQLNWCNYPANAAPCTNFATTWTSLALATPCPTNQQIVLQGSSTCQGTGDSSGNLGVYTIAGTYAYTLTYGATTFGPFTVSIGGSGGGGGGSPGGSDSQIQYNSLGLFAGANGFSYFASTGLVTIQGYATLGLQIGGLAGAETAGATALTLYASDTSSSTLAFRVLSPTGASLFSLSDSGVVALNYIDSFGFASAPPNPPAGFCRQYFNTTTGLETWINSSGSSCGPSGGGGGGTITGSGTAGTIPLWSGGTTILGNSLLSQTSGANLSLLQLAGAGPNGGVVTTRGFNATTYSTAGCANNFSPVTQIPINAGLGCSDGFFVTLHTSSAANSGSAGLMVQNTSNSQMTVGAAIVNQTGSGSLEVRGLEVDNEATSVGATNIRGGVFYSVAQGGTNALDQGLYVIAGNTSVSGTTTNNYGLFVDSPIATGTLTHNYGLFLADQTPGGANNPDPWGIFQAGAAKNQFGGPTTFQSNVTLNITGSTQCLDVISSGVVQGTGSPCSSITVSTNGTNNVIQNLLDNQTSATNAVGLTVTPTYHTGGHVQYEVTGNTYTGQSGTTLALAATPTNCGANSAAIGILANGNATGCFSPTGLTGLTQYGILYALSSTTATTTGPGLAGQVAVSAGTAGPPTMAGPALGTRAIITGTPTDTVLCDSGTAIRDRGLVIVAANGSTLTETIPDAGTSGCAANFVFAIDVSPINVSGSNYAASTVVTVNNTSSSKFYISNGLTTLSAQTSFTLNAGQWALINSPDNVHWLVRISVPTSLTTTSGPATAGDLSAWSTATNLVNATAHNVAVPTTCADSSGSPTAQSCSTAPTFTLAANDPLIYTTTTSNTGALTTTVNGSGAISWRKWSGGSLVALVANDIKANEPYLALYDGTFLVLPSAGNLTAAGATALSAITAATGSNTIASGVNQQNWNWALTGASGIGINFGETSAATGGTAGTQAIVGINTATASTATPLAIVQGTVNGTTNIPALNLTATWSNSSITGPAFQMNLVNTSSTATSCMVQWFAGNAGTTQEFCFDTSGNARVQGIYEGVAANNLTEIAGGFGTSANNNEVGSLLLKGSDGSATGSAVKAGGLFAIAGGLTTSNPNASALEGLLELGSQAQKGSAIAAVYDLVCPSATAYTYTDCPTNTTVITGVATSSTNPIGVISLGETPVNLDNTATIGVSGIICTSATTAGQGHYQTTACISPQIQVGWVKQTAGTVRTYTSGQNTGTQALSTSIPLVQLAFGTNNPYLPLAGGTMTGTINATSLLATGIIDGTAPITVTSGTTANLGTTYKSGYTFNQEATAGTGVTYTLPATAVGLQYCVRNSIVSGTGAADTGVLTVYPAASSYVILNGVRNTIGGGGTHGVASGGAAGDSACFVAVDATDWEVFVIRGTWTAN